MSGDLLTLTWAYTSTAQSGNNGNIQSQVITTPEMGSSVTQTYTYDGVNRLASFSETGGTANQTYGYDALGNRWVSGGWVIPC